MSIGGTMKYIKFLIIVLYVFAIGIFGFFYEGKGNLKAKPLKNVYADIDNYYDVDMPRYPNVNELPVIGEQYINNARAQSSYFITEDEPLNIVDFYKKYWEDQGFMPISEVNPNGGNISVYDYREKVTKTVSIKREGSKFRVLLTAIFDSNLKREFNAFSDIPHNKGSYGFVSYELEDDNYRASNIAYLNPESMSRNLIFYRKAMIEKGWKLKNEMSLPNFNKSKTLIFEKGRKIAEINITQNGMEGGSIIRLLVKDINTGLIMKGVRK